MRAFRFPHNMYKRRAAFTPHTVSSSEKYTVRARPLWRTLYCDNNVIVLGSAERGDLGYWTTMASRMRRFPCCSHYDWFNKKIERVLPKELHAGYAPLHNVNTGRNLFEPCFRFESPSFVNPGVVFSGFGAFDADAPSYMLGSLNMFSTLTSGVSNVDGIMNKSIGGVFRAFVPLWSYTRPLLSEPLFGMDTVFFDASPMYASANAEGSQKAFFNCGTNKMHGVDEQNFTHYNDCFTEMPSHSQYAENVYSKARSAAAKGSVQEEVITGMEAFRRVFPEDLPKMNANKELILDKAVNFDNPEEVERFVFALLYNITAEKIVFPDGRTYTFKEALSLFKNTDILDGLSYKIQDRFKQLEEQQQHPSNLLAEVPLLRYFSEKANRRRIQLAVHPDKVMTEDDKIRHVAESLFKISESIVAILKEHE